MSKISTATSIMFEEIKEKLEQIQTQISKQTNPNTAPNNLDEILKEIHLAIDNSTKNIKTDSLKSTENKVVNHVHSIELKSTKVCVTLAVLTFCLLVSLFFNFR